MPHLRWRTCLAACVLGACSGREAAGWRRAQADAPRALLLRTPSRLSALRGGHAAAPALGAEAVADAAGATHTPPAARVVGASVKARLANLVLWEAPALSAAVFAFGNAVFYLLLLKKWSAVSVGSWLLFVATLCGFAYTTFAKFMVGFLGPDVVREPTLGVAYLTPAHVAALAEPLCALCNAAIESVLRACWCVSYTHSLKYLAASYALSKLSRHVSLCALSYVAFVAAFALPKAAQAHREELDAALAIATERADEFKTAARREVGARLDALKARLDEAKGEALGVWTRATTLYSKTISTFADGMKAAAGKAGGAAGASGAAAARGAADADDAGTELNDESAAEPAPALDEEEEAADGDDDDDDDDDESAD
ncbi:hypothetical protein KFE25_001483 [Diacronema lutheri]|uniref:Reticulon-like protein n=1 Tax=Diacronema lutheri TaxID=2081491 RepID=A0A8J5XBL4_DIALT|nr:hypothetical protein KFE25_001483 [Diacronema lutheri]